MQLSEQYIVIPMLALLACTAITVARMRDLWAAVMMTGIFSFLGAGWMLVLDAPDVAFTEAAVGAGISTVLMLGTLALTSRTAKPSQRFPWAALTVVIVTGCTLVYGTLDLPKYGDPNAPIHQYPNPGYVALEIAKGDHGSDSSPAIPASSRQDASHADASHAHHEPTPNVVTVVLASYRGFDTLGETTVIFTAGIAVLILLRGIRQEDPQS